MRFAALALVLNLAALFLLLVPFINAIIFVVVNAYLLGFGYFEFAALRYHKIEDVRRLHRAHWREIFVAGLAIAALAAVPVANLLAPLFAAALMVRVHKEVSQEERGDKTSDQAPCFPQIAASRAASADDSPTSRKDFSRLVAPDWN